MADFLAEIPLERVWEVHMAGGHSLDGVYLDAHVGPVPAELLELARSVVPRRPAWLRITPDASRGPFPSGGGSCGRGVRLWSA